MINIATVDEIVLILINFFLIIILSISIFKDIYIQRIEKKEGIEGTITMTNQSLELLNKFYLTTTITVAFAIQVAEVSILKGYKSFFIVFDYAIITYLVFFNNWFRNSIIQDKILKNARKMYK